MTHGEKLMLWDTGSSKWEKKAKKNQPSKQTKSKALRTNQLNKQKNKKIVLIIDDMYPMTVIQRVRNSFSSLTEEVHHDVNTSAPPLPKKPSSWKISVPLPTDLHGTYHFLFGIWTLYCEAPQMGRVTKLCSWTNRTVWINEYPPSYTWISL